MPEGENIIHIMRKMMVESNEEMKKFISDQLDNKMTGMASDITKLTEENAQLRARNLITEGRLTRLEKVVHDLREQSLQDTTRSMRDNLVFTNIPEITNENNTQGSQNGRER